jgi:hypothetical protein
MPAGISFLEIRMFLQVQMKMAAEVNRRAEEERLRRLQLQVNKNETRPTLPSILKSLTMRIGAP